MKTYEIVITEEDMLILASLLAPLGNEEANDAVLRTYGEAYANQLGSGFKTYITIINALEAEGIYELVEREERMNNSHERGRVKWN